jgi:hypothetical protein
MQLAKDEGKIPLNLLECAEKICREFENCVVKSPLSEFSDNFNLCKAVHFFKLDGIVPDNKFSVSTRFVKAVQFPKDAGIFPLRMFWDKSKYCSAIHLPIFSGIAPLKLLVFR